MYCCFLEKRGWDKTFPSNSSFSPSSRKTFVFKCNKRVNLYSTNRISDFAKLEDWKRCSCLVKDFLLYYLRILMVIHIFGSRLPVQNNQAKIILTNSSNLFERSKIRPFLWIVTVLFIKKHKMMMTKNSIHIGLFNLIYSLFMALNFLRKHDCANNEV